MGVFLQMYVCNFCHIDYICGVLDAGIYFAGPALFLLNFQNNFYIDFYG